MIERLKRKSKEVNDKREEFEVLQNEDENIFVRKASENDMEEYGIIQ